MATVYVPSPLRRLTGGQSKLSVQGKTIRELLTGLERQYPGIRQQVCDETGEVRSFINVFVNGTEIRQLQGMATPLKDADEVSIIPAMAGGGEGPAGPNLISLSRWERGRVRGLSQSGG